MSGVSGEVEERCRWTTTKATTFPTPPCSDSNLQLRMKLNIAMETVEDKEGSAAECVHININM